MPVCDGTGDKCVAVGVVQDRGLGLGGVEAADGDLCPFHWT